MWRWVEQHQVLAVALGASIGFVCWELRYVLVVLAFGYIIASALRPIVDFLDSFPYVPRVVALLATYLALVGVIVGILVPATLPLIGQFGAFNTAFSAAIDKLHALPLGGQLALSPDTLTTYLKHDALPTAASALSIGTAAVSAIILSIYALYDWHPLHRSLAAREQASVHAGADTVARIERALGQWVRGQLLLSGIVGVVVIGTLFALGIVYAPVLGVFAALCEFIPYIGPFIAATPSVILAASISPTTALIVALAYLLIQQLENHVLVPLVMKHAVHLHPIVIIAVALVGFEVLGIIGVILAVPVTVALRIALSRYAV